MMNAAYILFACAFVLAVGGLVALGISVLLTRRSDRLASRMMTGGQADAAVKGAGRQQWLTRLAERGQQVNQMLEDPSETSVLLSQAGWRSTGARMLFYTAQIVLPIVVIVLAIPLWFAVRSAIGPLQATLFCVAAIILAILLPRWALRSRAKKRREHLRGEIPLLINLLILLFEAGLSTRQALTSLMQDGGDTLPELSTELRPVMRQLEAGGDVGVLLLEMSQTLNIPELESVVGILRQVERYGGEVREPLTEALDTIEERRGLEIREQVNLLSGKMTVVLVLFFMPALLVLIVGPAVTSILKALGSMGGS